MVCAVPRSSIAPAATSDTETLLLLLSAALVPTGPIASGPAGCLGMNRNTLRKTIRNLNIQVIRSGPTPRKIQTIDVSPNREGAS